MSQAYIVKTSEIYSRNLNLPDLDNIVDQSKKWGQWESCHKQSNKSVLNDQFQIFIKQIKFVDCFQIVIVLPTSL